MHRYLRTIDIAHDHFGFYLAWGSAAFLPAVYTLQAQYLAYNPVILHPLAAAAVFLVGVTGYLIFRSANHQKYFARKTGSDCLLFGQKAKFISCSYKTADGSTHNSLLLCSGT